MFVISIFIMMIMLVMTVLSFKNKFASVITFKMLLVSFMMIVGTMYLTRTFSYGYITNLDYKIYIATKALKFDCIKMSRIYNACLMLYIAFSIVEICFMTKLTRPALFVMLIPIAAFFIFGDFDFLYRIFICANTSSKNSALFTRLLENMKYICFTIFVIYMLLPYAFGIAEMTKTKIFTKVKFIAVELASIFLVDIFVYYTFVHGVFRAVFITNVSLFKIPENALGLGVDVGEFLLGAVLYFIIFGVVTFLIFFFGTLRVDFALPTDRIVSLDNLLNKHVSMHLHVYKNAFLAIGQQTNIAFKNYSDGKDDVYEILKNIDSIANSYLVLIEKNLSQRSIKNKAFKRIDVSHCISCAVDRCLSDSNIKITEDYKDKQYFINGDEQMLTEALVNLLINALESIKRTDRAPAVDIGLICEEEFCMISIKDNGVGIQKKDYRKIFHSFYSTKPKSYCGGVGLNYVKNVIKKHHGEIKVTSKPGEYAQFRIVLPRVHK